MSGTVTIETPTTATGRYRVEDGLLTVTYRGRSETTQLGGSPAEVLARIVLREMVNKRARRRDLVSKELFNKV